MTKSFVIHELANACNGKVTNDLQQAVTGFSIDTRSLKKGELFVALMGENQNGHRFIADAIKAGASAALVSEDIAPELAAQISIIRVQDTLVALQQIAARHRQSLEAFFIGVTGSNGKTTTRSMINHLLSEEHRCSATAGNLNNHIGLPLTLLAVDQTSDYAILEMGMNHQDEIRTLCRIARPHAAVISNIGPAHIGILGSLHNIALAKSEILEHLTGEQSAVVPGDTEFTELFRSATAAKVFTFGEKAENDYRIVNLRMSLDSISFELHHKSFSASCKLNLAGRHNALNAAAALAIYHQLGYDIHEGCRRMASFVPVGARMEKVVMNGINVLLDCYNANPGSMEEALKFLAICPSPRIAVLGDMRELGELSVTMHEKLGIVAAESKPDCLVCVGNDAAHIASSAIKSGLPHNAVIALNSNEQAAELLKEKLQKGSTVLFKASRGMHFETIVRKLWPELGKDLH